MRKIAFVFMSCLFFSIAAIGQPPTTTGVIHKCMVWDGGQVGQQLTFYVGAGNLTPPPAVPKGAGTIFDYTDFHRDAANVWHFRFFMHTNTFDPQRPIENPVGNAHYTAPQGTWNFMTPFVMKLQPGANISHWPDTITVEKQ
jgi:hypothetical protein